MQKTLKELAISQNDKSVVSSQITAWFLNASMEYTDISIDNLTEFFEAIESDKLNSFIREPNSQCKRAFLQFTTKHADILTSTENISKIVDLANQGNKDAFACISAILFETGIDTKPIKQKEFNKRLQAIVDAGCSLTLMNQIITESKSRGATHMMDAGKITKPVLERVEASIGAPTDVIQRSFLEGLYLQSNGNIDSFKLLISPDPTQPQLTSISQSITAPIQRAINPLLLDEFPKFLEKLPDTYPNKQLLQNLYTLEIERFPKTIEKPQVEDQSTSEALTPGTSDEFEIISSLPDTFEHNTTEDPEKQKLTSLLKDLSAVGYNEPMSPSRIRPQAIEGLMDSFNKRKQEDKKADLDAVVTKATLSDIPGDRSTIYIAMTTGESVTAEGMPQAIANLTTSYNERSKQPEAVDLDAVVDEELQAEERIALNKQDNSGKPPQQNEVKPNSKSEPTTQAAELKLTETETQRPEELKAIPEEQSAKPKKTKTQRVKEFKATAKNLRAAAKALFSNSHKEKPIKTNVEANIEDLKNSIQPNNGDYSSISSGSPRHQTIEEAQSSLEKLERFNKKHAERGPVPVAPTEEMKKQPLAKTEQEAATTPNPSAFHYVTITDHPKTLDSHYTEIHRPIPAPTTASPTSAPTEEMKKQQLPTSQKGPIPVPTQKEIDKPTDKQRDTQFTKQLPPRPVSHADATRNKGSGPTEVGGKI